MRFYVVQPLHGIMCLDVQDSSTNQQPLLEVSIARKGLLFLERRRCAWRCEGGMGFDVGAVSCRDFYVEIWEVRGNV